MMSPQKGREGGTKIDDLGWFSRHNWGDKGREGVKKLEKWGDVIYGWPLQNQSINMAKVEADIQSHYEFYHVDESFNWPWFKLGTIAYPGMISSSLSVFPFFPFPFFPLWPSPMPMIFIQALPPPPIPPYILMAFSYNLLCWEIMTLPLKVDRDTRKTWWAVGLAVGWLGWHWSCLGSLENGRQKKVRDSSDNITYVFVLLRWRVRDS